MYITVVQPGETLAAVAARNHVESASLVQTNGLRSENVTAGQALLVPSMTYYVQPGDTLASISAATGIPAQQLERVNPGARSLFTGRRLTLPRPQRIRGDATGYIPITDPTVKLEALRNWTDTLTWVPVFSYNVGLDGVVEEPQDRAAVHLAYEIHASPLLCVTNYGKSGFDPDVARLLFNDTNVRTRVINTLVEKMHEKGYGGIDVDIEQVPEDQKVGYVTFLQNLKGAMGPHKLLSAAVAPSFGDRTLAASLGHDYKGIGEICDRVLLMNYDFHWVGGPPGPHISLNQERRVLQYALKTIPDWKIVNGCETTAYDWPLPDTAESQGKLISDDEAVALAMQKQAPIRYDTDAQAPNFHYWDEKGQEHVVWFEDARSIMAKIMLMRELGIINIGFWHAGAINTQAIQLLRYFFNIITNPG